MAGIESKMDRGRGKILDFDRAAEPGGVNLRILDQPETRPGWN
jgi:hypothetical protein